MLLAIGGSLDEFQLLLDVCKDVLVLLPGLLLHLLKPADDRSRRDHHGRQLELWKGREATS